MIKSIIIQVQEELQLEPRIFIQYKDNEFVANLLNFLLYAGIFFLLYRLGRAAVSKMQSMQGEMMSKFTDKKFQVFLFLFFISINQIDPPLFIRLFEKNRLK
jgi:large-conductance mechanosensitive channel